MATKRLRALTRADLDALPSGSLTASGVPGEGFDPAEPWASAAIEQYGLVGVRAVNDDRTVAFVLVTPSFAVPTWHPAAAAGRTPGAAVVIALWISPDFARVGLARQVVDQLAARLFGRASCLDALAVSPSDSADLLRPEGDLLTAIGFAPSGLDHPAGTWLRLDLDRAVPDTPRWRSALAALMPWSTGSEPARWPSPASRD